MQHTNSTESKPVPDDDYGRRTASPLKAVCARQKDLDTAQRRGGSDLHNVELWPGA